MSLAESRLTGRRSLGVLLQGVGLLSLLGRAGLHLPDWSGARVSAGGILAVAPERLRPGSSPRTAVDLLRELLAALFGEGGERGSAGKGVAQAAARRLREGWAQELARSSADAALARLLEAAPLLWDPDLAAARRALAGEILGAGAATLWVAGPGPFRRRVLERCASLEQARSLLAAPEARSLWARPTPAPPEERLERARSLFQAGGLESALEAVAGERSPAARALAARCFQGLGRLAAAERVLRGLEAESLDPLDVVDLADLAARIAASRGRPERAEGWIRRALALETPAVAALGARIVAAAAAWDRGDREAMDRLLRESRAALGRPALAGRWLQTRALGMAGGALAGFSARAARALRAGRRGLARHQAAGLWNDLGLARARVGDLAGAERAFLHAFRLYEGCDGPRWKTLALPNLAEIRLRRGRLAGVREILERSAAENRRAGNRRGLLYDTALWARYELCQGRAAAALALCRDALRESEGGPDLARLLHALAARALGALGRPAEALEALARTTPAALDDFEPEERPALWAHAGAPGAALEAARGTPFEPLWRAALVGEPAPAPLWQALEGIEPFRAARLVADLERASPGTAPAERRREAARVFRKLGAPVPAEELEACDAGLWGALERYLRGEEEAASGLGTLFRRAGYGDVSPTAEAEGDSEGDAPLRALLALAARDLARAEGGPPGARPPAPPEDARPARAPAGELIGESPALREALGRLDLLAAGDLPVLILGESGTGKELAARRLHRRGPRAEGPFLAVNCGALSETLVLSDLFGHVRGAFTGADRDRAGVFEAARGGTVFLDEIGDLPPGAQSLLLRVLQEAEVRRLGESRPRRVDVRIVTATHRDLSVMVARGTFRLDLFYRLRVGSLELPPLRDRGDDVLRLAEHFLRKSGTPNRLSPQARERLRGHGWPGNVRELENVLAAAAALAGRGAIETEHLGLPAPARDASGTYHAQVEAFRRRLIESTLAAAGGSQSEAARRLGLSKQALSYLVRQLGLI